MPVELPSDLVRRPFSVSEARALGLGPDRLRRSDLSAPFRGVRSLNECTSLLDRCRAIAPVLADDQFVSHVSSLHLWGLPLPRRFEQAGALIHVTSIRSREPRRKGVAGHQARTADGAASIFDGVPLSSPIQAWVESRALLDVDELIIVGDAMVSKWSPLRETLRLQPAELTVAADAAPRAGRQRIRHAAQAVRQHSRSAAETQLRLLLVAHGIREPVLNYDVLKGGMKVACVDLAYPERRLALEYEGEQHFTDLAQYHADIDRRERLAEAGWRTVRITKRHLFQGADQLCRRISAHLGGGLQ